MTQYYLVNQIRVGSQIKVWPGTLLDSNYDEIDRIRSVGGWLVESTNATVANAAKRAAEIRAHGGPIEEATMVMLAAFTSSVSVGVLALPDATTLAHGWMAAADKTKLDGVEAGAQVNLPIGTTANTVAAGDDPRIPAGIATRLSETPIAAGSGTVVLWSHAIPESTVVGVIAKDLNFSANGTYVLIGTLSGTAKRIGSGSLSVTSAPGSPWELSAPAWNPRFAASGNTLQMLVDANASGGADIVPRGTVLYNPRSTAEDPVPVATIQSTISGLIGAKIIEGWFASDSVLSGSDVSSVPGAYHSQGLTNETSGRFQIATVNGKAAWHTADYPLKRLISGTLSAAPVAFLVVAKMPTLPWPDYTYLIGLVGHATPGPLVGTSGASTLMTAWGATHYIDAVLTETVTSGATHVIECLVPANTYQVIGIGGDATNPSRTFLGSTLAVLALSAALTSGELAAVNAACHAEFGS